MRIVLWPPVIPYDPAERRRKFPEAFDQLRRHIAAHEQLAAEEQQKKEKAPFVTPEDEEADLISLARMSPFHFCFLQSLESAPPLTSFVPTVAGFSYPL